MSAYFFAFLLGIINNSNFFQNTVFNGLSCFIDILVSPSSPPLLAKESVIPFQVRTRTSDSQGAVTSIAKLAALPA
jgi:hypothetical protein